MNGFLLTLLLQSSPVTLPPRAAMENPAVLSQVPQKLKKDYDKMWNRFVSGRDDAKLLKDLDKLLSKQKALTQGWTLQAYLYLHKGDEATARQRFTQALVISPGNRIALFYLAEIAYAHGDYARASALYAQLLSVSSNYPDIETKRQKALLLATDKLLQDAAAAEADGRLLDAEDFYRHALKQAPNE